jgi:HAMP domain-containing protein
MLAQNSSQSRSRISKKFNMALLSVYLLFAVSSVPVTYVVTKNQVMASANHELNLMVDMVTSVRNVVREDTRPHFMAKNEFFPPVVSSTVMAKTVAEKFKRLQPDYYVRIVSDNPLNTEDLPGSFEKQILDRFRATEDRSSIIEVGQVGAENYLVSASPAVVKEGCLTCHGSPSAAPALVTEKYGTATGYNWEVGKVIGASLVGVPLRNINEIVIQRSLLVIVVLTIAFAVLFLLVNMVVKQTIIKPVLRITEAAKSVSRGAINDKLEHDRNDELGDLVNSFELMRRSMVTLMERKKS